MSRLHYACLFAFAVGIYGQRDCGHGNFIYLASTAARTSCDLAALPVPDEPIFADFNGDGRDDIFCNKDSTSDDVYLLTSASGVYYGQKQPRTGGWCLSSEGKMMAGDINGDGTGDLVCRFNDGKKFQARYYRQGRFSSPTNLKVALECPMTSTLYIVDVSGDRKDDFVCFDQTAGKVRIHYNGADGARFRRHAYDPRLTGHVEYPGYYEIDGTFCRGAAKTFVMGDFNGDKKHDLMCYDEFGGSNGQVAIAYAESHGHFDKVITVDLPSEICGAGNTLDRISVDDINGDGMHDMLADCTDSAFNQLETIWFFVSKEEQFTQAVPRVLTFGVTCSFPLKHLVDLNGDGLTDSLCFSPTILLARIATCRT